MENLQKTLLSLKELFKSMAKLKAANPKISSKSAKSPAAPTAPTVKAPAAPKAGESMSQKDPKKMAESIANADGIETKNAVKDAKAKKETLSFDKNGQWKLHTK